MRDSKSITRATGEPKYTREFMEDQEGVHLMNREHTLCGLAFDAFESGDAESKLVPTTRRAITCQECANVIKLCRRVQVRSRPQCEQIGDAIAEGEKRARRRR
jgi:hypothetical protein